MKNIPFLDFGGSGPLLHFAHANAYPPGVYEPFLRHLASAFHVVATCHRPVWPSSSPDSLHRWRDFADDMMAFFAQEGFSDMIGVGHSMGAVMTMYAANSQPARFRKLVLIDPVFLPLPVLEMARQADGEPLILLPQVQGALRRRNRWPSREANFEHYRTKKVFRKLSDDALRLFSRHGLRETDAGDFELAFPREWEARIYALPPVDVWDELARVAHPTLAIRAGETDTLLRPAWKMWQTVQPEATFVEIPDATHLLPLEMPALLAGRILGWLAGR